MSKLVFIKGIKKDKHKLTQLQNRSLSLEEEEAPAIDVKILESRKESSLLEIAHHNYDSPTDTMYEIHFRRFNSHKSMLNFLQCEEKSTMEFLTSSTDDKKRVYATGGGAYKYANEFKEKFDADLLQKDEMTSLIHGGCILSNI